MECFLVFFVGLAALIVLGVVLASRQTRTDRWNDAYRALARRFGGVCHAAGWYHRPSVRFRYGRTNVLLDAFSRDGLQYTRICVDWPDRDFWCEIFPTRMISRPSALWEKDDADVAAPQFNRRYAIRGSDQRQLRSLLSEGVQWQFERLRHFLGTDEVGVSVGRGRMSIKKLTLIRHFEQLEEFTFLAMELFDQAMLTRVEGINFIEDQTVQPITEAVCQVCGENIEAEMVFCRRCKTPHHLDCWQYYGSCTTYGCRETHFVVPKIAGPSQP